MADFTGFYLDGIHSSTYGILRVSNGKRYSETLIPEFEDYELELAGGDGSFYGGSNFKKTSFEIKIAFDKLTEQQFRQLRHWLGKKELQPFRFDERPYKTYWVKLESAPKFDYVCFMEQSENGFIGDKERIYKGEGDLKFIAYDPFGYCIDNSTKMTENGLEEVGDINWQVLDSYTPFEIVDENISEWGITSELKRAEQLKDYNKFETQKETVLLGDFNKDGKIDQWDINYGNNVYENLDKSSKKDLFLADFNQNGSVDKSDNFYLNEYAWYPQPELIYAEWQDTSALYAKLYNPGDFDADFQLFIDLSDIDYFTENEIIDSDINISLLFLNEEGETKDTFVFSLKGTHKSSKILLNTKNHSLAVFYNGLKSLRYDLVKSTHWPKISVGESIIKLQCTAGLGEKIPQIKYNYKYY